MAKLTMASWRAAAKLNKECEIAAHFLGQAQQVFLNAKQALGQLDCEASRTWVVNARNLLDAAEEQAERMLKLSPPKATRPALPLQRRAGSPVARRRE